MNGSTYGLIFNDGADGIWLGKYDGNTVRTFERISDFDGVYEDLPLEKFAFVMIENGANDQIVISDISTFEMKEQSPYDDEKHNIVEVTAMLEKLNFPSNGTDNIFRTLLTSSGKMN